MTPSSFSDTSYEQLTTVARELTRTHLNLEKAATTFDKLGLPSYILHQTNEETLNHLKKVSVELGHGNTLNPHLDNYTVYDLLDFVISADLYDTYLKVTQKNRKKPILTRINRKENTMYSDYYPEYDLYGDEDKLSYLEYLEEDEFDDYPFDDDRYVEFDDEYLDSYPEDENRYY